MPPSRHFSTPFFLITIEVVLSVLSACARTPDCFRTEVFCAGLVTDTGGISDHGLNQEAWQGLQDALADKTIQYTAYIESIDSRDYEKNLAYFARDGYDFVIAVGMGQRKQILRAANLFSNTIFIGLDQTQEESRPNLYTFTFPEDQMGFLAGALAAMITKTHVVGAVCETSDIESNWQTCEGFRKGVHYINKDTTALVLYRENQNSEKLFADPDWGKAAAENLIQRGADVIFGSGGGTGQGALSAAAQAHVYAIGAEQDQWFSVTEARPVLITSVLGDGRSTIRNWLGLIHEKKAIRNNASGSILLAPFHDLDALVSNEMRIQLNVISQDLQTGLISTGVSVQTRH
jgi:basic membrane protein A